MVNGRHKRSGWRALAALPLAVLLAIGCAAPEPGDDPLPAPAPEQPLKVDIDGGTPDDPCDGLDNDGDGDVDEECYCQANASQLCYTEAPETVGIGICRWGIQRCTEVAVDFQLGFWGSCESVVGPSEEICGNGIDEDCDGADEPCPPPPLCTPGATEACYDGPDGTVGIGICRAGEHTCTEDGEWGPCLDAVLPLDEICGNGVDEDCDTLDKVCVDPPCTPGDEKSCYGGPAGTLDVGVCSAGTQVCSDSGVWLPCDGAVLPAPEICNNGIDEDCSGTIDNCG